MGSLTKRELRHAAIARRKTVPAQARLDAGEDVARHAAPLFDALASGATVAAYVPMGSEIDVTPLLDQVLARGLRLLVPMLGGGMDVGWGELASTADLRQVAQGRTRPDEPDHTRTLGMEALHDAAVVVVPALGVDTHGTRLGRGGGWYDRALEHKERHAPAIAVCWPWEVADGLADPLPHETHDLPVDGVLTPEGLRMLR